MIRRFFAALYVALLLGSTAGAREIEAPPGLTTEAVTLPILMYHEVKHDRLGKDVITPAEFESDLKYLREKGYVTVTMAELISYVYQGTALPEKPVVISFDDGYLSNYVYVLPLLKQYRAKIVLSIIGKSTDEFTQLPDDNLNYAHVSWQQLREMLDTGLVEVQNHTYNMHRCGTGRQGCTQLPGESCQVYESKLTADLDKLQESLYANTGRIPTTFAYPYGFKNTYTEALLRELGFRATLSCEFGVNRLSHDPDCLFSLRRICRSHGESLDKLLTQASSIWNRKG